MVYGACIIYAYPLVQGGQIFGSSECIGVDSLCIVYLYSTLHLNVVGGHAPGTLVPCAKPKRNDKEYVHMRENFTRFSNRRQPIGPVFR